MFWFIIFDFIYTDILVKKLISTDSARDTDYGGIFFVGNFIELVEKNTKNWENFLHYLSKLRRFNILWITYTAWKVSKYGVISGPYFPVFGLNTMIYGVNSVFSPNTGK